MAPTAAIICNVTSSDSDCSNNINSFGNWRDVESTESNIVEGWSEGFMLGALFIMAIITVLHMKKGVLLHKLILLELLLAMSHGTFCFMAFDGYGFYLSSTAALLYCSYFTHNIVAWMKIKPFFTEPRPFFGPKLCYWVPKIYLITLGMTIPVYVFQIFNNFRFFNNISTLYESVRPYEPLIRDPWWVFSCVMFFRVIAKGYGLSVFGLMRRSPRLGIMLAAICFALCFTVVDISASITDALSVIDGINPYWKLAVVFKCLADNILLDDFKSVLQSLSGLSDSGKAEGADFSSRAKTRNRDATECSDVRSRKRSMTAHAVGKLGMKINKLPKLSSMLQIGSKSEGQCSAEMSKATYDVNGPDTYDKHDERPSWKHSDSESGLTDPTIEVWPLEGHETTIRGPDAKIHAYRNTE